MLFAWLLFAPAGIITATFNKTRKAPMVKKWFMVHQALLTTTVFLTLIAFFIMVNQQGFMLPTSHSKLGFTVVILAILQPLSGVLRPHIVPGEAKSNVRVAWEYGHQIVGRVTMILAVAAAILGVGLAGAFLRQVEGAEAIQIAIAVLFTLGSVGLIAYVVFLRPDEREVAQPGTKADKVPDMESQTQASSQAQAQPVDAKAQQAAQPQPGQQQAAPTQKQEVQPTVQPAATEAPTATTTTTASTTTTTQSTDQTNVTQG